MFKKRLMTFLLVFALVAQTASLVHAEDLPQDTAGTGTSFEEGGATDGSETTGGGETSENTGDESDDENAGENTGENTGDGAGDAAEDTGETGAEDAEGAEDAAEFQELPESIVVPVETVSREAKATKDEEEEIKNEPPADGFYVMTSALDNKMCADISGASLKNGANLQLYQDNGTNAQIFQIKSRGNDQYSIINFSSGLALDVCANQKKRGTNVQQYAWNGTTAQFWKFTGNETDGFTIQGVGSGLVLDVSGASKKNGANIQIWEANGTDAQKWFLKKVTMEMPKDGVYEIVSALDRNYALDISGASMKNGANVQIYKRNGTNAQKFYLLALGHDDLYTIACVASDKRLDVAGNGKNDGTNVVQYEANGTTAQQFKLLPQEDGSYEIRGVGSDKSLDVKWGKAANGTNVHIWTGNNTKAQRWILNKTSATSGTGFVTENGNRYYVENGKKATGWRKIAGQLFFFDNNGVMQTSGTFYGRKLNPDGTAAANSQIIDAIKPGGKTLKNYLQNALVPCGRTLYIWAGGWNTADSQKIGYLSSWDKFFREKATPNYDWSLYKYWSGCGLDCSGFVSWITYNTLYTKNNQQYLVKGAHEIANFNVQMGWANSKAKPTKFSQLRPGDVCSMGGHVYLSLGACSDGSAVIIHSSGNGVQLSGTQDKNGGWNSEGIKLARQYMKNYFPQWPYTAQSVGENYIKDLWAVSTWKNDPDNLRNKSAKEILKLLLGD